MITVVLQILLDRLDLGATLPQTIAAPRASQRKMTATLAEPAFVGSPEGQVLAAQYGHRFSTTSEIGAAPPPASSCSPTAACSLLLCQRRVSRLCPH